MIDNSDQKGIAIILVIIMISILMFLGIFFITSSLTEKLISSSQTSGMNAYYLAESGVNEMIWRVINDPAYENDFMHNAGWATTTMRMDPFGPNSGSYTVTASNTSASHCDIISTGKYDIGNGNYAQRVVKTNIFRAIGTSVIGDSAGYADGNITITNSYVKFLGGSAHSNNTFNVNNQNVQMYVDSDLQAVGNYLELNASTTIKGWIYAANWASYARGTGTAAAVTMPAIDFNSGDPNSYKNRAIAAGTYFTASQFDNWICSKEGSSLTLTKEVTYVAGDVNLNGDIDLRYPPTGGVLIVEGDFTVGSQPYKQCGTNKYYGYPGVTFMYVSGKPSGVMATRKVSFLDYTGNVDIEGVVYADAEMNIRNLDKYNSSFYVKGGLVSQKLDIDSCYGWPTVVHDNDALVNTIGAASSSPTIIIAHWEEEY